ncbi:YceI family protein [Haliea sp. E17]|uniref:YceI family protein n=1 Tax=Haliea sp. E17 TaxID=3401576 RepID=UPI003AAB529F
MRAVHCILAVCLAALSREATAACRWQAVQDGSELSFTATYAGQAMTGRFSSFDVAIDCDPGGRPTALLVSVDTGSADMQDDEANAELQQPDWFDVSKFPRASYRSEHIAPAGAAYLATGHLTLKGLQVELQLPFDWQVDGDAAVLEGEVELSRTRWHVGSGEWATDTDLADAVAVRYRVQLVRGE